MFLLPYLNNYCLFLCKEVTSLFSFILLNLQLIFCKIRVNLHICYMLIQLYHNYVLISIIKMFLENFSTPSHVCIFHKPRIHIRKISFFFWTFLFCLLVFLNICHTILYCVTYYGLIIKVAI